MTVNVYGPAETLTMTLPLTSTDWQHVWWDVPCVLCADADGEH